MSGNRQQRSIYLLAQKAKKDCHAGMEHIARALADRYHLAGQEIISHGWNPPDNLPDRILVLGGDGTLISVARSLGPRQIPLIGVNLGKLGYLTEFSVAELVQHATAAVEDNSLIRRRMLLSASFCRQNTCEAACLAVNDCVIHAGPPYRMVSMNLSINGDHVSDLRGDGLIISTPIGSTAHNMSAGGPILQADINSIVITPICPHSLTHRPIVVASDAHIEVTMETVNEGTTAIIDGQVTQPLAQGDVLEIQRYESDLQVVRNPILPPWFKLVSKLHWGKAVGS